MIYGSSDDLVQVEVWLEGELIQYGELGCYVNPVDVIVNIDGRETPVTLGYNDNSEWDVSYTPDGSETFFVEAAGERPELCFYSAVLTIEGEAEQVEVLSSSGALIT